MTYFFDSNVKWVLNPVEFASIQPWHKILFKMCFEACQVVDSSGFIISKPSSFSWMKSSMHVNISYEELATLCNHIVIFFMNASILEINTETFEFCPCKDKFRSFSFSNIKVYTASFYLENILTNPNYFLTEIALLHPLTQSAFSKLCLLTAISLLYGAKES